MYIQKRTPLNNHLFFYHLIILRFLAFCSEQFIWYNQRIYNTFNLITRKFLHIFLQQLEFLFIVPIKRRPPVSMEALLKLLEAHPILLREALSKMHLNTGKLKSNPKILWYENAIKRALRQYSIYKKYVQSKRDYFGRI